MTTKSFPLHQTVSWWIEQLQEFDPNAVVKLATGPGEEPLCMLSIYTSDDTPIELVYIDVGEPGS